MKIAKIAVPEINACIPSPCGPNSECHEIENRAACSCLTGFFGAPPKCRPECLIHQDCPSNRACINQHCEDPCLGACGFNAQCSVLNHRPICTCLENHEGDPYAGCSLRPSKYNFFNFIQNIHYNGLNILAIRIIVEISIIEKFITKFLE